MSLTCFYAMVVNQFGIQVQTIWSENEDKCTTNSMQKYFNTHRIDNQASYIGTPKQNGWVKASMFTWSRSCTWISCMSTSFFLGRMHFVATILINWIHSSNLSGKSSYELIYKELSNAFSLVIPTIEKDIHCMNLKPSKSLPVGKLCFTWTNLHSKQKILDSQPSTFPILPNYHIDFLDKNIEFSYVSNWFCLKVTISWNFTIPTLLVTHWFKF